MRLYLRPTGDTTQYSDLADYLENPPFAAPSGFEWVEGEPPETALPVKSLSDQLDAVFETLDVPTQAQFSPLKAAVQLELDQGRTDVAKAIVQGATVPSNLAAVQQEILRLFP